MNATSAKRARQAIEKWGHVVTFKRTTGSYPTGTTVSVDVKAIVSGYRPEELINGITLGGRKVIVSETALSLAGFPTPLQKSDKVVSLGKEMAIQGIDRDRREYQGVVEIAALGQ